VTKAIHLFLLWAKKEPGVPWPQTTKKRLYMVDGASICLLDFDGVNSQSLHESRESILNVKYLIASVIWVLNAIIPSRLQDYTKI
jgi:hypothetical protein